ncbi:flagellar hook assembly protein FlgD [Ureibacillus sinduriensis]|uniref:Basal-body rod modification protein FlgD n=1 Tax=Ureibacillus sinduriensis BLB-1 = JCM 15800 TaxID=1384057 RepID=A0A0A3HMX4_9BACL|nr:flagellar hook assembly protein FlgD [Ureibacillus sinduriensis]KGR73896.1 flagellar basal body rod modification protein FlgD [Ureibacillus sinduriensis BLB-1 = JCM 15800]
MATTGISNDYFLASTKGPKISKTGDNSSLGKDAFLNILITQLQNQDPTQPMDDKEFISQMAQFSSLEQMQNMTTAMQDLLASQNETQLMSYTSFIGKEVKWHEITEEVDEAGKNIINEGSGVINELKFKDGEPIFVLGDGKEISPGHISSILNNGTASGSEAAENPLVTASKIIGQMVRYQLDGEELSAKIESVTTNGSLIEYILNNGTRLQKDQFELISE